MAYKDTFSTVNDIQFCSLVVNFKYLVLKANLGAQGHYGVRMQNVQTHCNYDKHRQVTMFFFNIIETLNSTIKNWFRIQSGSTLDISWQHNTVPKFGLLIIKLKTNFLKIKHKLIYYICILLFAFGIDQDSCVTHYCVTSRQMKLYLRCPYKYTCYRGTFVKRTHI